MQWLVIGLFVLAAVLFAVGRSTRVSGRSPDEKAGSDIPYVLGMVVLALNVALLVGWALVHLFFS
jgi:hypothetical protein